jgi:hypothetical protein
MVVHVLEIGRENIILFFIIQAAVVFVSIVIIALVGLDGRWWCLPFLQIVAISVRLVLLPRVGMLRVLPSARY